VENVTIREAESRDRSALVDCYHELQAFEQTIEPNRAEADDISEKYVDDLISWCAKYSGAIFVAEVQGEVVGFSSVLARVPSEDLIERDPEFAEITDLVVRQPYRRSGIGALLLEAAESHAVSIGATRLRICVLSANTDAHRLYQRCGFRDNEIVLEKRIG
jgi:GNAT superfamily N-acetyltransferase